MPMNNTSNLNKLINKTTHKRRMAISQYRRQQKFFSRPLAKTKFSKCFLLAARRDGKTAVVAVFDKSVTFSGTQ